MKKSELRALIREALHEELLREAPAQKAAIDEKGFLSSLNRSVSDELGGKNIVDDNYEVVATVPTDLSPAIGPSHENDGARRYLYTIASGLPMSAKPDDDLMTAIRGLTAFWREYPNRTGNNSYINISCKYSKRGDTKDIIFEVELIPTAESEIFTKEKHDWEFNRGAMNS